jgi:hypothetical protein
VGFFVSAETHPKLDGKAHLSPIWPEKIDF